MSFASTAIPALYAHWMITGCSLLTGGASAAQAGKSAPKPAPAAAEQEWEDEGGCVKQPDKPKAQPAPKLPL